MSNQIPSRTLLFMIFLILVGLWSPAYAQLSTCGGRTYHVQDSLALVALYNATDGPNWTYNTNWLQPGKCLHEWDGVRYLDTGSFRSDRVWWLGLGNNNLVGSLPDEIGMLAGLTSLGLGDNHLSGALPASMVDMDSLYYLSLGSNDFGGFPEGLDELDQVVHFDYSSREPAPFPEGFEAMESLETLGLVNGFTGSIPDSYGDIPQLRQLILRSNMVTGGIPAALANLDSLERLILPDNALGGEIPPEIGNLTNLLVISLEDNQLEGEIPASIGNLSKLFRLVAYNNRLEGELPASMGNLSALEILDLSRNLLTGALPEEMGNLENLRDLYLSSNAFTGQVPASFDNLTNLRNVRLDWNALTGLPRFSGATSLRQLWVYQNRLTFDDVIPIVNVAPEVVYSHQDSVGPGIQIVVEPAAPRTLFWGFTTPGNQYQWSRDGVEIPGAIDLLHVIPSMGPDDEGGYVLTVTNPAAPDLTLHTRTLTLDEQPLFVCYAPAGGKHRGNLDPEGVAASCFSIKVVEVEGEVELLRSNQDPVELRGGEVLVPSDRIYTGIESAVRLAFADNSTVVVQELTDVKIGSFEKLGNAVNTQLWLKAGEVDAAVVEKSAVRSDFKIRTPTATCSVRGTSFSVNHDSTSNTTTVRVADGEVVAALLSNPEDSVVVTAWQTVDVTEASLGVPESFTVNRISITPETKTIRPNAVWQFSATGYTAGGASVPVRVAWTGAGGQIDTLGYYVAGLEEGTFGLSAIDPVHGLEGEATVTVSGPALVASEREAPAADVVLGSAFPNPFRVLTSIPIGVNRSGVVRLSVYDLLGREVAVLVNGDLAPGSLRGSVAS